MESKNSLLLLPSLPPSILSGLSPPSPIQSARQLQLEGQGQPVREEVALREQKSDEALFSCQSSYHQVFILPCSRNTAQLKEECGGKRDLEEPDQRQASLREAEKRQGMMDFSPNVNMG